MGNDATVVAILNFAAEVMLKFFLMTQYAGKML